ncbi:hypothetical protein I5582_16715 [Clostridioides difficile]|nr:hypothetical protein [Clostridioides difficile]
MDLKEILETVKEKTLKDYDKLKRFTNTDEGKEMIVFCSKTIDCRKVNDWGRDRDTDMYIGLDDSGWIIYTQESENLAGPFKIISEKTERINENYLVNYFHSKDCLNYEFMNFMKVACK